MMARFMATGIWVVYNATICGLVSALMGYGPVGALLGCVSYLSTLALAEFVSGLDDDGSAEKD